ncbi:MAG: ribbon-helix-helix protein, CopG family [Anaerolineae bacterium]|nr:ribbon-helix-helix protein, CopG family [Anaerolineae bacterium]
MSKQINIRMEQDTLDKLDLLCHRLYRNRREMVRWLIDAAHENLNGAENGAEGDDMNCRGVVNRGSSD